MSGDVTGRPSLEGPDLQPLWETVRLRLPALPSRGRHLLGSLVGGPVRGTVDLAALECTLRRLGVGESLAALGHQVSSVPAQRRAARGVVA